MSDRIAHILQARHNEELAKELIGDGYRFKDWAVTAAFYAAMHYFEARLHEEPSFTYPGVGSRIFHTETSIPKLANSNHSRFSPHGWRDRLIKQNCSRDTVAAYRELRNASQFARYHEGVVIASTSHDHYTSQEVDRLISNVLEKIKTGLGIVST